MGNYFLSYSRTDQTAVDALVSDLQALGHWVWFDKDLPGGTNWWTTILHYIRETDGFLLAVSQPSIVSRACLSELRYAEDLGKPVLPIGVTPNIPESLLPPSLGQINRVPYDPNDRNAAFALSRAIGNLPRPAVLPDPLPAPPEVPASYMFDIRQEIDTINVMDVVRQQEVMGQLRKRYDDGLPATDVSALVGRFRQREDLVVGVDRELAAFELELRSVPQPPSAAAEPPRPQPSTPESPPTQEPSNRPPVAHQPPPPTAGTTPPTPSGVVASNKANPLWWIAPILFGILGGAVAYFALKNDHPETARNMLIVGIVLSVVGILLIGAGGG